MFVVVLLQLLAAYFSPLSSILGTVQPSAIDWVVIVSSGLLAIAVVEMAKAIFRFKRASVDFYSATAKAYSQIPTRKPDLHK